MISMSQTYSIRQLRKSGESISDVFVNHETGISLCRFSTLR